MDVEKLKSKAQELGTKAQDKTQQFLKDHSDQIESGVSKAEKFAKSKTPPKHTDKVDKAAGKIRSMIPHDEKPGDAPGTTPPGATPGDQPGPTPPAGPTPTA
ncbi:MAG TPA: antitoxin [Jatrophihabitantaceae bacterium]|jgi:hypothetical protein